MTDAPAQRNVEGTWARLRQRKVVQWGIAYAAGAWGLLQGVGFVADAFYWPGVTKQIATFVLLIGFPIALVLAWYHGDRGEQRVTRTELAILTLLFLIGGGIFWRFHRAVEARPTPTRPAATPVAASSPASNTGDTRPSIAVLPFENRSAKQDDVFFVDGIHDDILTQLTKVSAMKVISRTSVERFRDTKLPTKDIAAQLGVAKILEGGVQRAGDRVRITVQLIDAATDAHLWAENYDRKLTAANIFAIQSEVATAIAAALKATLTVAEQARVNAIPTQNLDAWEDYQLGRQSLAKRTVIGLAAAEGYFRKAIVLDPKFAAAHAGLADAIWLKADYGGEPWQPAIAKARKSLKAALAVDPNLGEAITSSAKLDDIAGHFDLAEAGYRRAIEVSPSYAPAYLWYAMHLDAAGRRGDSLRMTQIAVQLDPLSALANAHFGGNLANAGRIDEAIEYYRKAMALDPNQPSAYSQVGELYVDHFGQLDKAIPWIKKSAGLDPDSPGYPAEVALHYLELGDDANADVWCRRAMQRGSTSSYVNVIVGMRHLVRGDKTDTEAFARRAIQLDSKNWYGYLLLDTVTGITEHANEASQRYLAGFPELGGSGKPTVTDDNFGAAIGLATAFASSGDLTRSNLLLEGTERLLRQLSPNDSREYALAEVQILSLRGRTREAIEMLQSHDHPGLRTLARWLPYQPALAALRNDARFKAILVEYQAEMARQRAELAKRPKDAPLILAPGR